MKLIMPPMLLVKWALEENARRLEILEGDYTAFMRGLLSSMVAGCALSFFAVSSGVPYPDWWPWVMLAGFLSPILLYGMYRFAKHELLRHKDALEALLKEMSGNVRDHDLR